jgi:hypothetical protein
MMFAALHESGCGTFPAALLCRRDIVIVCLANKGSLR